MQPLPEGKLSRRIIVNAAYSFSAGFLLFLIIYGFYMIFNTLEVKIKVSYIVMIFSILFILSSVVLEHRGGQLPRLFIGGAIVSAILTFFIICIVNGILAIISNNNLSLDIFLLIYSLCIIAAFVALKIFKMH